MNPGALRHTLVIERPGSERNALGVPAPWETVATVRAEVWSVRNYERGKEVKDEARAFYMAKIRSVSGTAITTVMRATFNGRVCRIIGVDDVSNPRETLLSLEYRV